MIATFHTFLIIDMFLRLWVCINDLDAAYRLCHVYDGGQTQKKIGSCSSWIKYSHYACFIKVFSPFLGLKKNCHMYYMFSVISVLQFSKWLKGDTVSVWLSTCFIVERNESDHFLSRHNYIVQNIIFYLLHIHVRIKLFFSSYII